MKEEATMDENNMGFPDMEKTCNDDSCDFLPQGCQFPLWFCPHRNDDLPCEDCQHFCKFAVNV